MYGDFSKPSFIAPLFYPVDCKLADGEKAVAAGTPVYSRVLVQQGRPLTDADLNEQAALLTREIRELARSIIGWHGSPDCGFLISKSGDDKGYLLREGTYFIDGMRCANDSACLIPKKAFELKDSDKAFLYLEAFDANEPPRDADYTFEPALQNIRPSVRGFVKWMVRIRLKPICDDCTLNNEGELLSAVERKSSRERTLKLARMAVTDSKQGPCDVPSTDASFTTGNLLYRIEIHGVHKVTENAAGAATSKLVTTVKWSRVNGSDTWNVESPQSSTLQLIQNSPATSAERLQQGDCVELVVPRQNRRSDEGTLFRVSGLPNSNAVQLARVAPGGPSLEEMLKAGDALPGDDLVVAEGCRRQGHSYLRRWEHLKSLSNKAQFEDARGRTIAAAALHVDGALKVPEVPSDNTEAQWLALENGILISLPGSGYEPGDYWYVRVRSDGTMYVNERTAVLSDPKAANQFVGNLVPALPERHFAPLAFLGKGEKIVRSARFRPIALDEMPRAHGMPYDKSDGKCNEDITDCKKCFPDATPPARPTPAPTSSGDARAQSTPSNSDMAAAAVSLLSSAGKLALKRYASSPKDLTRRIPARYLNHETRSAGLKRWLRTALVSEIHEATFERFIEKVLRSVDVSDEEKPQFEEEAREVYGLATSLRHVVASAGGIRQLIA